MGRSALTVGINTYDYPGLKNLEAPARDAEAIAQQLESSLSPFRVERLPEVKDKANDGLKTGKTSPVTLRQLQEALVRHFDPRGTTYSDTGLFYFSGHGIYDDLERKSYLATSDTDPKINKWGYPLTNLSALLRDSPVKRQIIWLDCCHSGGLIAVNDANPGEQSGYSRCFVAASQEIELAYQLTSGSYSVLTDGLLQGLNPERIPGQWVDTLALCAFVNQYLKNIRKKYPQRSLFLNVGEPIELTYINAGSTSLEGLNELQVDVCPYRALNAFDFTPEDVKVFFGRTALTDELLAQIYEHNFLAVLGPSGSGKSSVVRAGLLYELQQGKRRSGTETWHILPIIRPGESPLRNLAGGFVPEILRTKKKGEALLSSFLTDLKAQGAAALVDLIKEDYEQPVVIVVDQFEEIFTLCRGSQEKEQERKEFLDCLFEAVDTLAGQLRLVITLRADFLGKCLEQSYGNLAERIKDCRVDITPLTDSELDEVINKPAATVGLRVAPYLQDRLREHIREAPGSLPLLEYALTELWRDWHTRYTSGDADIDNQLTFEGYDRIGGVAGALEKQANAVYESFAESTVKQGLVQRIFLELVQPGEETEDTRRQVLKRELISEIHPESVLDEVLGKLVEARLVVTDEVPTENDPNVVVIELAHEATIRHWQQLRYWLNKHRQDLPIIRQLRTEANIWQANHQQPTYLLVGVRLDAALDCLKKYQYLGYLSEKVEQFVQVSKETWIADEKERERQILEAMCMTAEVQWSQHQQLESLLTVTQAGKRLQQILKTRPEFEPVNSSKLIGKLQETIYSRIREKNRLETHSDSVNVLAYSPDGTILTSASADSTIRLWNATTGSLIATLKGHSSEVYAVAYSPDGNTIASASQDSTVKLWNVEDTSLLFTCEGHSKYVMTVVYSPDGTTLASAGGDKTIKLWNVVDGNLITTLEGHSDTVNTVVYSPDGTTLASGSDDKTVKLWSAVNGQLITTLEDSDRTWKERSSIRSILYSPDGSTLISTGWKGHVHLWDVLEGSLINTFEEEYGASSQPPLVFSPDRVTFATGFGDGKIKVWDIAKRGRLVTTLEAHKGNVGDLAYSPDGTILASAGADKTVKLWDVKNLKKDSPIAVFRGHKVSVNTLAYKPDGTLLASAGYDETIRFWQLEKNSFTYKLEAHSEPIALVVFSPDGTILASGSDDRTIKLWNVKEGSLICTLEGHTEMVLALAFYPDGKTLASSSRDGIINLWNVEQGSLISSIESDSTPITYLAYSPDGTVLASISGKILRFWNTDDYSPLNSLEVNGHVTLSPNMTAFAFITRNNIINFYSMIDTNVNFAVEGCEGRVTKLAYSPNGTILASANRDRTIQLWNTSTADLIATLELDDVSLETSKKVYCLTFNSTGTTLITSSEDAIRFWDVKTGNLICTLEGNDYKSHYLAYSPNDNILVCLKFDNTIRFLNLEFDYLMDQALEWLQDYLSNNPNVSVGDKKLLKRCS
ncbi:caspase family protein [Nostoc linckia FACHB-104]|nr:caspase family protein [Nostoc linckia FACHB-104]